MMEDQQPVHNASDIQELITLFLSASLQEEQQIIAANTHILLSDNVITSLRGSIVALEQKLARLEEMQKGYGQHKQIQNSAIDQEAGLSEQMPTANRAEVKTETDSSAVKDAIDAPQEAVYSSINIPQQPYIPRSEAEIEAMLTSMTSEQLAQAFQVVGGLNSTQLTQMLRMVGETEQLNGLQINILHAGIQQLQGMKPEEMQKIAEQVKALPTEQFHITADAFKTTSQNIGDAQMEQVAQRFRTLDIEQLEAMVEDVSQNGLIGEAQKDMLLRGLQELQAADGNQLKELVDIVLKAQLTGRPIDTNRLQELHLPLMQSVQRVTQEPEQVIAAYTQELATLSREQNPFHWARLHYLRGGAYGSTTVGDRSANLELALEDLNAALSVFTRENSASEWGAVLMMRAALYMERKQGHFAENRRSALADCETGIDIFVQETFPLEWARIRLLRGSARASLCTFMGERGEALEKAIMDCSDALSVFTSQHHPEDWRRAMVTRCAAHSLCDTGNLQQHREQALIDANVALEVVSKDQFPEDWASLHCHRALAYWQRVSCDRAQNLDLALADCEAALTIYTMKDYPEQRVMVLNNRAMIRMDLGHGDLREHIEHSINDQLDVLSVLPKETQPFEWATAHLSCAILYLKRVAEDNRQNLHIAYDHCNLALEVFTKEQTPVLWGQTLVRRGVAQYSKLPKEIHQVLENRLGLMNFVVKGPETVLQSAKSSYEVFRAAYDDFDMALTVLTEENAPTDWALAHSARAQAYKAMNIPGSQEEDEQTEQDYEKAQKIFTRESKPFEWAIMQTQQASALLLLPTNQTHAEITKNAQDALKFIASALQIYTAEVSTRNYQYIKVLQALAYERLNDWENAHKAWLEARKVRRTVMAMALGEQGRTDQEIVLMNINIYKHDAQALLRCSPPDVAEAAIALEEGRAQGLRLAFDLDSLEPQKIENRQARKRAEILQTARERWRQCQQRVEHLFAEKNIAEYSEERQQYVQELQGAHDAFMQAGNAIRAYDNPDFMSPVPTLASIAQAIFAPEEALVYLVAGSYFGRGLTDNLFGPEADTGLALVVMQDGEGEPHVRALNLPLLTGLTIDGLFHQQAAAGTRLSLDASRVVKQAGALGMNDLVALLQQGGIRKITFVPYGILSLLPLAAIRVTLSAGKMAYLGDLFEVCVAPSARSCEMSRRRADEARRSRQRQGICLVGNPFPLFGDVEELPLAESEADTIKQMVRASGYAAAQTQHLSREEANRQHVVAGLEMAQYAHLAMHGMYDATDPLHSHLVLAGDGRIQEQERSLTLREVLKGTISLTGLRLLVLSACETSLIDLRRVPDEVVGLAAGFLQAGVAGVIASLWRVDEMATYLLMVRFACQYLDAQGLWSPARALSEAQRWLRQEATNRVLATYDPLEDVLIPSLMSEESQMLYNQTILKIRRKAEAHLETTPDTCPYADPRYWAAFVVTGH